MKAAQHITDEALMLMAREMLSDAEKSALSAHLSECPRCCQRLRKTKVACAVLQKLSEQGFSQVSRPLRTKTVPDSQSSFPWTIVGGIVLGCLLVIVALFAPRGVPRANASELLGYAVQREAQSGAPHLYQISVNGIVCIAQRNQDELVVLDRSSSSCGGVLRRIQTTPWGHGNPISARKFQAWRASLGSAQDTRVKRTGAVEIETTTDVGSVSTARLFLRLPDYQATKLSLRFDDYQELTVSETTLPAPALPGYTEEKTQPRPAYRSDDAADVLETSAWRTLWELKADSGWNATVSRHGSTVTVRSIVESDAEKQRVLRAFAPSREILVEVHTVKEGPAPADFLPNRPIVNGDAPPLANAWLLNQFPNDQDRMRFVNDVLQLSQEILGRAYWNDELKARRDALAACSCSHQLSLLITEQSGHLTKVQSELGAILKPMVDQPVRPVSVPISYSKAKKLDMTVQRLLIGHSPADNAVLRQQSQLLWHLLGIA